MTYVEMFYFHYVLLLSVRYPILFIFFFCRTGFQGRLTALFNGVLLFCVKVCCDRTHKACLRFPYTKDTI